MGGDVAAVAKHLHATQRVHFFEKERSAAGVREQEHRREVGTRGPLLLGFV